MGVISDFLVADKSNAEEICLNINSKKIEWVEIRGIFPDNLMTLLRILKSGASGSQAKHCPLLYEKCDTGPWLYEISAELVALLSQLKDSSRQKTAEKWVKKHKALSFDECSPEDAERCLVMLRNLCKRSKKDKLPLLLRVCL